MPTYRIAFVNPYVTAAEVQAFESLRRAAAEQGVVIEHKRPKDLSEDDPYDFLIPVAFGPKTTSHPSFLSCHSPRAVYVDDEETFGSIASHDGFLSISDNLKRFFGDLSAAWEKPLTSVGDYYNCPQATTLATDLQGLAAAGALSLCYFGINWDMRAEPLFRALSQKPYLRIYGPPESWRTVRPQAYKGQLPFDGLSVQQEYARFGVGLICLGYEHLMDDIISNRVFEISSVGAASISPDTPWMRKTFGDSVLYYDPFTSVEGIVQQVDAAFHEITRDPSAAAARAAEARRIFEARFHAGAMMQGAIAHFQRWKAAAAPPPAVREAEIDVVILGDGKGDGGGAEATRASLLRQTAGRVRVVAASALPASLEDLRSPFVAVVRAGDRLLSNHFARLLPPLLAGADVAYGDVLGPNAASAGDLRITAQGPAGGDAQAVLDRLRIGCLLVRREVAEMLRAAPSPAGLGDLRLVAARLLAGGRAVHRSGPTLIEAAAAERPGGLEARLSDALAIAPFEAALRVNAPPIRPSLLAPIERAVTDIGEARLDAIASERVFEGGMIGRDVSARDDVVFVDVPLSPVRLAGTAPWARAGEGGVAFQPVNPFDIALRVDIADYVIGGCRPSVVFSLASAVDPLFLGLVSSEGALVARSITPKSRKPIRLWVNSTAGDLPAEAVIQAWKRPPGDRVVLQRLTVAYRVAELAVALGEPSLTREQAHQLLEARAETEVAGEAVSGQAMPLKIGNDRTVLRQPLETHDGSTAIGMGLKPWDYVAQIFVPAEASKGAKGLRLDCGIVEEPCSVLLVNTAFDRVLAPPVALRGGKRAATVWLPLPADAADLYLVVQASETPAEGRMELLALSAVAVGGVPAA